MYRYDKRYPLAEDLMATMVAQSQQPGRGNLAFNEALTEKLDDLGLEYSLRPDPEYDDRQLLVVDIGPSDGEQVLVATSHADVVGTSHQRWDTDPYRLHTSDDYWVGRGTCDTHGSGVSMLLAGLDPAVQQELTEQRQRISLLFTYDEEATSQEFSMRGARLAAGLLGPPSVISANYFIAGEPTEVAGKIHAMRAHKGRYLAHFTVETTSAGHASEEVGNALVTGARIVCLLDDYNRVLTALSRIDPDQCLFSPPNTTLQVTAAAIKEADYSTTPDQARFTIDMRTLPSIHKACVENVEAFISHRRMDANTTISVQPIKNSIGTTTPKSSPIVRIAEAVIGCSAKGFNGGNEGRIFRDTPVPMEGVTLGPGRLQDAHGANERVRIASVLEAANIYRDVFCRVADHALTSSSNPHSHAQ